MRRRSAESARAQRNRDEGKIIELQLIQNTLEQRVKRLEHENRNLYKQLHQAQQGMESMRVGGTTRSGSRISKAKSETDLSRKFHKYTAYDKHKYRDLEPVAKAGTFSTRGDSLGLGSTRYSSLDADYTRSHDVSVPSRVLTNGCGSEARTGGVSYYTVEDRLASHEPVINRTTVPRYRVGSLGEDSKASDDLEHTSQPRWRTQSAESSSSVAFWDHGYSAYSPVSSRYQRDDRNVGSRRRPHSCYGGN